MRSEKTFQIPDSAIVYKIWFTVMFWRGNLVIPLTKSTHVELELDQ